MSSHGGGHVGRGGVRRYTVEERFPQTAFKIIPGPTSRAAVHLGGKFSHSTKFQEIVISSVHPPKE